MAIIRYTIRQDDTDEGFARALIRLKAQASAYRSAFSAVVCAAARDLLHSKSTSRACRAYAELADTPFQSAFARAFEGCAGMWSLPAEKDAKYDFVSDRAGLFIRRGGKDELFWEPLTIERSLEDWDTQRDFFHAALDGVDFLSVKVKAAPKTVEVFTWRDLKALLKRKPALDDTCAGLLAQLEQADKVTRRAADAAAKQAEAAAKSSGESSGKSSKAGKAGKSSGKANSKAAA